VAKASHFLHSQTSAKADGNIISVGFSQRLNAHKNKALATYKQRLPFGQPLY